MATNNGVYGHQFGGSWTDKKLAVLGSYLDAYTTALKNQPFSKLYVDAFAGTGSRVDNHRPSGPSLFYDEDLNQLKDGSARVALSRSLPFDRYLFIEKDHNRFSQLAGLKDDFPTMAARISILQGDANAELKKFCQRDWRYNRAVVFLDPYGVNVEWQTIEAIANTRSIDLWVLFPLAMGVGRMVTNSGDIPAAWAARLNRVFGTEEWRDKFYENTTSEGLFGPEPKTQKVPIEEMGRYYNQRLGTIFAGIAPNPAILRNSKSNPLYLLCFATGNPKGKQLALKLANYILDGMNG
jgi:three-Cys-motif partner protein